MGCKLRDASVNESTSSRHNANLTTMSKLGSHQDRAASMPKTMRNYAKTSMDKYLTGQIDINVSSNRTATRNT